MFGEVIVGVNFGPGGDAAIALALGLISDNGRMTLTNVVPSDPTVFRGRRDDSVAAERARSWSLLERECRLVELRLGDARPPRLQPYALVAASAGRGLHAVARHRGADLIVVGASRGGGVGRVLFGDDTRATLRAAPCAVGVAPRAYAGERPLRRVGVVDSGSAGERQATAIARALDLEVDAAAGDPTELSRRFDLLVVGPARPGRWLRLNAWSSPERLARQVACPLLVAAPPPGAPPAGGSPPASVAP